MKELIFQYEMDKKISDAGAVAVVQTESAREAVSIAKRLYENGTGALEIAYRNPDFFDVADECIRLIRKEVPQILVGGATVINPELAERAFSAGAQFVLSPGLNPSTVEWCLSKGLPVYPGVCTPSEVEQALAFGLKTLKFFPAECCGGTGMLKALKGPFPGVKFIVSGGLNQNNFEEYKKLSNVCAVSGSWLSKV